MLKEEHNQAVGCIDQPGEWEERQGVIGGKVGKLWAELSVGNCCTCGGPSDFSRTTLLHVFS